ncbi:MAG: hypothetical protein WBD40_06750 [Tepidisphaeraceae bacterium]
MMKRFSAIVIAFACHGAAPATQPAIDTPQGVQAAYRAAMNAQDAKAALALFHLRTPGERATAEVLVANDLAAARLAVSAEKAFGIPLMGGGTLLPPAESDAWRIEGGLATIPQRKGSRPIVPPLREEGGRYKIDLVAWGMNWMDAADGDEARARHAHARIGLDETRKRVDDGFYRTLEELGDHVYKSDSVLAPRPGNLVEPKAPRPFRRPVKLDLSSPRAACRSAVLSKAEGDGEGWLRCHAIVDPSDQPQFDAYARFIGTGADLEDAAVKRFGAAGVKVAVFAYVPQPRREALREWSEMIEVEENPVVRGDEATWEQFGDSAAFVRVGGEWKLRSRAKADIGQKPAEEGTDWTRILQLASDLQVRFAREIAAGKFATVQEAKNAIDDALKPSSTTGPA